MPLGISQRRQPHCGYVFLIVQTTHLLPENVYFISTPFLKVVNFE
jgi:hypothetical protein